MDQPKTLTWGEIEESLANESGLAVVVVEGEDSRVVSSSNDSSICQAMQASPEFSKKCAKFCGKAFLSVKEGKKDISAKCHAGLNYIAVQLAEENYVAIVGRSFLRSSDYRNASKRAESGDWKDLPMEKMFGNVLLSGSAVNIEALANRIANLTEDEHQALLWLKEEKGQAAKSESEAAPKPDDTNELTKLINEFNMSVAKQGPVSIKLSGKDPEENEEFAAWRSFFGTLKDTAYNDAIRSSMQFLAKKYQLASLAWLERRLNKLETKFASGKFKGSQMQFSISADDLRLGEAARKETSLELRDVSGGGPGQVVNLFVLSSGEDVRAALVVGDKVGEDEKRSIARFCKNLSSPMEILSLRAQLEKQAWLAKAIQKFNESLKRIDSDDFWAYLAQTSAELMHAERGSLLVFDDEAQNLIVKAAIGSQSEFIRQSKKAGERVAAGVWESGRAMVVKDIGSAGMPLAPSGRNYKTGSFISYPISIGARKVGVLNITDKVGGGSYDEFDLELLNTIAPQIAIAIDRASLKTKAGEYEQLSITDGLTGLMNRRYLEARLAEELKRSQREGYPMSFLMIDVDDFKAYNDKFLHTEGDKALQIVSRCLKETLRGADIAARYGGEEFSILLPQTSSEEAMLIAERIRKRVEKEDFAHRKVTISIGVAACSPLLHTPQAIKSAADRALYEAKSMGKNRVVAFQNKPDGAGKPARAHERNA